MDKVTEHTSLKIESREQFESLFNEHYANLCAYANNFLKDVEASEEVVQDVLFKLWINRGSIEINTSVSSYLFRSVRNAALNVIKHVNIREDYKVHNERMIQMQEHDEEDKVIVSELEEKIRKAIDELPLERRKIFIMSRYEGLKYREIADKLDISVKTVENQMGSALKHLRTELQDYLPWLILFFNAWYKQNF